MQQIPWDFRSGEDIFWETHAQSALQARQKFHTPQAIEAEVAFQRAVEADGQGMVFMGMEFAGELLHNVEQRLHIYGGRVLLRRWLR